jgi:hypothetical protein
MLMDVNAPPEVVYAHFAPGAEKPLHVGSGRLERALSTARGGPWRRYVDKIGGRYEVRILERHSCPARARLREGELIAALQPETNVHHRNGPHRQVLRGFTKGGARCACGAPDCYGAEAAAREA